MVKKIDSESLNICNLSKISMSLKDGKLIVYPAETLYGIGCDYRSMNAILSLQKLKGRDENKGFLLLASSICQVENIAHLPQKHLNILERFWPGQLTAVLAPKDLPDWILYKNKVAIRLTSSFVARRLIDSYGSPIVSTSLNFRGDAPIKNILDCENYFHDNENWQEVAYIITDNISYGEPSTVVDLTLDTPKILRQGAVKL